MTARVERSRVDLDALAAQFEACSLPHQAWTHRTHLAVGLWYVERYGANDALARLRVGIRRLNDHHGTPNSPMAGYHETVTRAFVRLLAQFIEGRPQDEPTAERLAALFVSPLADERVLLSFYSPATIMSESARAHWVEPDLAPLELADVRPSQSNGAHPSQRP
jgi:hypothetical protein